MVLHCSSHAATSKVMQPNTSIGLFDLYKASVVIMVAILAYTDNQKISVCIICKSRVAYCTHSVNLFD